LLDGPAVHQLLELANGCCVVVIERLPVDHTEQGKVAGFSCLAATAAWRVAAEASSWQVVI